MPDKLTISRIGVFRALQLGDMLCIIPTIRAVRKAYPSATITLIGLPWQHELVMRFPDYFNRFIEFPGWPGLPERDWAALESISFLQQMSTEKFDLVLQMQGDGILTNSMCLLWNAGFTVGLRKASEEIEGRGAFPVSEDDEHEVKRFLKLLKPLGISEDGDYLEFPILRDEISEFRSACHKLELQTGRYLCIHPGARDFRRRWPAENFATVARALTTQGYQIVITGSKSEAGIMKKAESFSGVTCINTIEKLGDVSLGLLACLIAHCELLISNDTGVSHLASALRTPSVIIFSQYSQMNRWAPLNTDLHQAISYTEAQNAEAVIAAALHQLQLNKKKSSGFLNYKRTDH